MSKFRVAVVGAGSFGQNHIRILRQLEGVELVAVVDSNLEAAVQSGARPFADIEQLLSTSRLDAAVVASPTATHIDVASRLLEAGVSVLVEKPIAQTSADGEKLIDMAKSRGLVLQVGHLERFNPAVLALEQAVTVPLFFEVHRMSVFTPRSLDIDVVLDLMIHDLDIVLSLTGAMPEEIRAAGISVLSPKVDIANVRLAFASGCIANLTASRVSTERIRKLRLFQPGEYLSLDYQKQELTRIGVRSGNMGFESLPVTPGEPLRLELESFIEAVQQRQKPRVDGQQAVNALRVGEAILAKIEEHAGLVARTLRSQP
jgi:predicted dehydrogenase